MSDKLFFEINFNQENKKNKINKINNIFINLIYISIIK
jgi:hypothetical protein